MATVTQNVTNSNTITVTLASVTTGTTNTSSAIDNSTAKYLEALVQVKWKTGAAGTTTTGNVTVYLIRSADAGTTYDDANKVILGVIPVIANATTYIATFSTAAYGSLGTSWKIAVQNNGGGTSDTTAGNFSAIYSGVKYDVA